MEEKEEELSQCLIVTLAELWEQKKKLIEYPVIPRVPQESHAIYATINFFLCSTKELFMEPNNFGKAIGKKNQTGIWNTAAFGNLSK